MAARSVCTLARSARGQWPTVWHTWMPRVSCGGRTTQEEVALFGVNYYTPFWHNYPDLQAVGAAHKQVIDQDVLHFARMGLDALRLHVFDRELSDQDGNLLANEHLDLLDYLIARAKERGIYTVLTPDRVVAGSG